jgi:hypothetical protein
MRAVVGARDEFILAACRGAEWVTLPKLDLRRAGAVRDRRLVDAAEAPRPDPGGNDDAPRVSLLVTKQQCGSASPISMSRRRSSALRRSPTSSSPR